MASRAHQKSLLSGVFKSAAPKVTPTPTLFLLRSAQGEELKELSALVPDINDLMPHSLSVRERADTPFSRAHVFSAVLSHICNLAGEHVIAW